GHKIVQGAARHPSIGLQIKSECIESVFRLSLKKREALARYLKVPVFKAPSTYCNRVTNAFASGQLTPADWAAMQRGQATENLKRVIRR
ncbi:MAG: hypothetical protein WBF87_00420, partial [Mesorhizobium sp.]